MANGKKSETRRICDSNSSLKFWFLLSVVTLSVLLAPLLFIWLTPTVEEKLKTLDAARAIPDEENAALVYAQILSDYYPIKSFADLVTIANERVHALIRADFQKPQNSSTDSRSVDKTDTQPWRADEYPEVIQWLNKHERAVTISLRAAQLQHCRFHLYCPISPQGHWDMTYQDILVYRIFFLADVTARSAYLDLGRGRTQSSLSKAMAVRNASRHLGQHPTEHNFIISLNLELKAYRLLNTILIASDIRTLDLDRLQDTMGPLANEWNSIQHGLRPVRELYRRQANKHIPILTWLRVLLNSNGSNRQPMARYSERYLEILRARQLHCLLIEARRAKEQTGTWPATLKHLEAVLPEEVSIIGESVQPMLISYNPNCFLMVHKSHNLRSGERTLLVYDGRVLIEEEKQFIDRHLHAYFEFHIRGRELDTHHSDLVNHFIYAGEYSVPILLGYLQHSDPCRILDALELLGKMADPVYCPEARQVFFLEDLIAAYHREQDIGIREHYLKIMEFFGNIPSDLQAKAVAFLEEVMERDTSPDLRTQATLSLLHVSKIDALCKLLNQDKWLVDEAAFGPDGYRHVLGKMNAVSWNGHAFAGQLSLEEMAMYYGEDYVKMMGLAPTDTYCCEILDDLKQWHWNNRAKLEAIRNGDPNALRLMEELFPLGEDEDHYTFRGGYY